jgi:hypothetical protein
MARRLIALATLCAAVAAAITALIPVFEKFEDFMRDWEKASADAQAAKEMAANVSSLSGEQTTGKGTV